MAKVEPFLDRSHATAELVLEIATAAAGEAELDEILRATLDRLGKVVPLTGGSIALVEDDDLVIRAAVGPFADEALGQRMARGNGRSWNVLDTGEPFLSRDLAAEGVRPQGAKAAASMRSWLGVPIVRKGQGIGLLEIDSTLPDAFDERDVELVQTIVRALAGPVDLAGRYAAERRAGVLRDAFIGVISHELRTPITTIYGLSKMLRSRATKMPAGELGEAVADIEAEADRLHRLAEDLLVLSRAEGGSLDISREPILLSHISRRAVGAEEVRWPAHAFILEITAGLPPVLGEEIYVEQVIRNLLTNAAKYSDSGSEIKVVLDLTDDRVRVRVLDRGIGIEPDDAGHLFELFYRSTTAVRHAAGAGIGLFVCKQLVEAMGGRIYASPREDGGAEFGFTFPVDVETEPIPEV
jgi:signal transduction histidine kinase